MATSAIKRISLLPGLIIAFFLFAATASLKANAAPINAPTAKGIQLAHWYGPGYRWHGYGPGWYGPGVRFYGPGFYGPGYRWTNWGPGYGCQKRCFVNRWNRIVCATRCY
ncbi:Uncharacterised protein [Legionella beliardensis]|uniref:Glycine-rich protein n=1 Tax=Legionella beliardensis TaxID=91822 RepID=A0A378HZH8_9GAMM|nr:hypothetical protein [Legionella beliardensis]STX28327.1 Uncharacterised protein [Legionella beliardensis]